MGDVGREDMRMDGQWRGWVCIGWVVRCRECGGCCDRPHKKEWTMDEERWRAERERRWGREEGGGADADDEEASVLMDTG